MKIIHVDKPFDEGERPRWQVVSENSKVGETFKGWLKRKQKYVNKKDYITGIYLYDIQPIANIPETHLGAMIIRYDWIKEI